MTNSVTVIICYKLAAAAKSYEFKHEQVEIF